MRQPRRRRVQARLSDAPLFSSEKRLITPHFASFCNTFSGPYSIRKGPSELQGGRFRGPLRDAGHVPGCGLRPSCDRHRLALAVLLEVHWTERSPGFRRAQDQQIRSVIYPEVLVQSPGEEQRASDAGKKDPCPAAPSSGGGLAWGQHPPDRGFTGVGRAA